MVIRGFRDDSVSNHSSNESGASADLGHGKSSSRSSKKQSAKEKSSLQKQFRQTLIESLEVRNLMAGPQLIGIQPNNSDLIEEGVVRDVAPRELTFRFDQSQVINPQTTGGIRLTRSGGDGSFGLNSASTDFGSAGKVDIQLTMRSSGQTLTVNTTKADRGTQGPLLSLAGNVLTITLNSNATTPTTAGQLVNAINSSTATNGLLTAVINGGFADARLGTLTPTGFGPIRINQTNDLIVTPASSIVSNAPNQNEVKFQFAETLADDAYRIEVFGFDNAQAGIVGLRNSLNELFVPRNSGTNRDTFNFRLDLGSKVLGVVPQPIVRDASDRLTQRRDEIVVYFDNDKLLVENDLATGLPTSRSAENVDFYQLIYTSDTIKNTAGDDFVFKPVTATYNASANTVTLKFAQDINNLRPANSPNAAYRLRVGTRESLPIAPVRNTIGVDLGDTFTTATNVGVIGSQATPLSSFVFTSEIKTNVLGLDNLGASDDSGHRDLGAGNFENHINSAFGPDSNPGITKINYNFRSDYGSIGAAAQQNSISINQRQRVREALQIWSRYLGVQFVETDNEGFTFATGNRNVLNTFVPGTQIQQEAARNFGARIDPTFQSGLLVLDASRAWNENYGEDYYRHVMTGIGMMLGLTHAGDLPASTLLALNATFLNANGGTSNLESIFPGTQDILHGKFIHRADNSDIDLYRFVVDFGANDDGRVGKLEAETFAERGAQSSSLDTYLRLYKEQQATAIANFGATNGLGIQFTAVAPGRLGNNVQIAVSRSAISVTAPGYTNNTIIRVSPNLIQVELNSTPGSETTIAQLLAALQSNPSVTALVSFALTPGSPATAGSTIIGATEITYSPITLQGGGMTLLAQNDNYFSEDSLLRLSLGSGVYYLGVSASGNDQYDPTIPGSGKGGRTEGAYELRVTFRAQTDSTDTITDTNTRFIGDEAQSLDGDADGITGGVYNFWFETRPENRIVSVNAGGSTSLEGQIISITGANGATRRLEFSADSTVGVGNTRISYTAASTPAQMTASLITAINSLTSQTGISATLNVGSTTAFTLVGERTFSVPAAVTILDIAGKTIFVDKLAGPNADGSLTNPFNNIQGSAVANAFGSALPGDIVRIVGNGGNDRDLSTTGDNFAYEFGIGLIGNAALSDGAALEVPKGVIAMIDAGAIFKSRRSRIAVGSSNAGIDRSGSNLQILGTPVLVQNNAVVKNAAGQNVPGSVFFTSWLDESLGRDTYGPSTTPASGDWGGIILQRDVDRAAARFDKEEEGIFLNYINFADIRFGGGGGVVIDSVQQAVNPIQIVDGRPTISFNTITNSADAALSASPNSFDETLFTDKQYQARGAFTPDYDRVGPSIHDNRLVNNSINGLFVKITTLPADSPRSLTVAGRFDDIDVTHVLSENLLIQGTPGGSIQDVSRPSVQFTTVSAAQGGTLASGIYNYIVTFVDIYGNESVPSQATPNFALNGANNAISIQGISPALGAYTSVRLYRSSTGGVGPYNLVARLAQGQTTVLDRGQNPAGTDGTLQTLGLTSVIRSRLDASLVIDPGITLKVEGSRIELGHGTQLLAEGTEDLPITITSKLDDSAGAGGTFDTNNDRRLSVPAPANWGGIFVAPGASISLDHTTIAFAGGVTRIDGTFRSFNALEIQQADARIANSTFRNNATGVGGQGPEARFGRLANEPATILVRGSSPVFLNNFFDSNTSTLTNDLNPLRMAAISIDVNSMNNELQGDTGRMTGSIDRVTTLDNNRGPLFRGNSFNNNDLNGLKIRADDRSRNTATTILDIDNGQLPSDALTVESVWDDTDIVHVLYDGIFVENLQHEGGLRLQSSSTESLVVKMIGAGSNFDPLRGTGLTARGTKSSIDDRVGGTIHIVGQPGFPVVLTSLRDDSVGAGLKPDGTPQTDTNNNGIATIARPGDWRGVMLDQNSHDRNVAFTLETEPTNIVAPGTNGSTQNPQVLGSLAADASASDENLRLGFVIKGILNQPEDVDVYSFSGVAGTEVWFDIDHTTFTLDTVVELLDANGTLIARSNNSGDEAAGLPGIFTNPLLISSDRVQSLAKQLVGNVRRNADGSLKEDGTTNPRDAGFRVVLPGPTNTRTGYFFRVRSNSTNIDNFSAGITAGSYEIQVRLREAQEVAGSIITGADIRFATNGIHLRGLPASSPLLGEASESESQAATAAIATTRPSATVPTLVSTNNNPWSYQTSGSFLNPRFYSTAARPDYIGNIAASDRGVLSVAGNLATATDADFFRFSLTDQDLVNPITGATKNLVFDIDYADGLNRADTNLSVYRLVDTTPGNESWQLIYFGEGSNIADDQRLPLSSTATTELTSGSLGINDPFINAAALGTGEYLVAVTASNRIPTEISPNNQGSALFVSEVDTTRSNLYSANLLTILPSQTPTLTFSFENIPAAANYFVLVNNVAYDLSGSGDFVLDLSPFAGTVVSIRFGAITPPTTGALPTITNVLVSYVDTVAPRTPFSRLSTPQLDALGTGSLNIPGPIGAQQIVNFDLSNYSAGDLPAAYFDYALIANDYTVTVQSSGAPVPATFLTGAMRTDGTRNQAKVDLRQHAGQSNVRLIFTSNVAVSTATVDNLIVGFAERGETVTAAARSQSDYDSRNGISALPLFAAPPILNTTPQTGRYQLEIRSVTAPTLTDTNDRDGNGLAITVPTIVTAQPARWTVAGDASTPRINGDTFAISDGVSSLTFEFTSDGIVQPGNVAIVVQTNPVGSATVTSTASAIAQLIRDAINSPSVQSRFTVRAAGVDGTATGTLRGNSLNLFNANSVTGYFKKATDPAFTGALLREFAGNGDANIARDQGQIIIAGNFIRESRDYGIWSEAGLADYDPRDLIDVYSQTGNLIDVGSVRNPNAIIQSRPRLVGSSPGPARNLPTLNADLIGGFTTGVVITNNVLDRGGLGGISVAGESPIWMITPYTIPVFDSSIAANTVGSHFGSEVDDGDQFFFDSDRTRVGFEFDDIAGAPTAGPNFGSGTTGGNGVRPGNVPVHYREDEGSPYLRSTTTAWGYSALETVHALRDAVMGSILVTNGTTQNVTATVGMSLLPPVPEILGTLPTGALFERSYLTNAPGLNWANRPALFVEGLSNVYFRGQRGFNPWIIQRIDKADSPQPFARIINNTVIGNDGRASFNADTNNGTNTAVNEPNDTLVDAVRTEQGSTQNPTAFNMTARIGDNGSVADGTRDVDFYQFYMNTGDRVRINIDTTGATRVDTVLQLFNASGQRVNLGGGNTVSDNVAAPGETVGVDPYIDYTATAPGVYYAAVSASGNVLFNPQLPSSGSAGSSTGTYQISLSVAHPQEFTITVEDESSYADGDTFTVFQVADLPGGGTSRTFEFTRNANYQGPNVPVFIGPNYFVEDIARSIAIAINNSGLNNVQNLSNGSLAAANPLNAVSATALGGIDGVEPGLRLFPFRIDGLFANPEKHSFEGIGHDRTGTRGGTGSQPFGSGPTRADGAGTTERFVVVRNAAAISSNGGNVRVDPDLDENNNLNQLIPESGILVSQGATPTILNNVFYNVQTPIVREETRSLPPGGNYFSQLPLPFGSTNPQAVDRNTKPTEIIVGGNVYQYVETAVAANRQTFGIQGIAPGATNVPNTQADFNFVALNTDQLLVNPQAGRYLPAAGSRVIDSSIDSLVERSRFAAVKAGAGLAPSPVLAPNRDALGQLRVDDPNVSPPQGLGGNVFKDRGALDRADTVGPTARLLNPIDNDSNLLDKDPTASVVQLESGIYPEFRIQLSDSFSTSDPFPGIGIDDDTVVGPNQPPVRLPGANVTISDNGRTLREGIDYTFAYNATTKEIILTPLAGVWQNNRVFEITLNNRDRFVVSPTSGEQVADGDQFTITDSNGGVVTFEYDSGYRLQLPQGLTLNIPSVGAGPGGISDGSVFSLRLPAQGAVPSRSIFFEMDSDGVLSTTNPVAPSLDRLIRVPFLTTDNAKTLSDKILAVLVAESASIGITAKQVGTEQVNIFIGATTSTRLTSLGTNFSQPSSTLAIVVPSAGAQVGGVVDGDLLEIFDGVSLVRFEFDTNFTVSAGNTAIDLSAAFSPNDVAIAISNAIAASGLTLGTTIDLVNDPGVVFLGLPSTGSVAFPPSLAVGPVPSRPSALSASGIARNLTALDTVSITNGNVTKQFVFVQTLTVPADPLQPDRIEILLAPGATQDEIGDLLAAAIRTAPGLNLQPVHLGSGNIAVGGTTSTVITRTGSNIGIFGLPGVTSATTLTVNGSLRLSVPPAGGQGIADNATFSVTNNLVTRVFEFDRNSSGPSAIGNVVINYSVADSSTTIAGLISAAINTTNLGLTTRVIPVGSRVELGVLPDGAVQIQSSGLLVDRGGPIDGEFFTVSNGTQTITYEFDNLSLNNGTTLGRIPIAYSDASSQAQVASAIVSTLNSSNLGTTASSLDTNGAATNVVRTNDTARFVYNFTAAPSLVRAGVSGGAQAVRFVRDPSFNESNMRAAIVNAINNTANTTLSANVRSGGTLFVSNATAVSTDISSYFLRGIQDLADNNLQPTRQNDETQFTILMPGTMLDFANAPDPFTNAPGRYPTVFSSDGARHVVIGNGEVQQVGWDAGNLLTGTFTLSHGGQSTVALPANASAQAVQTALENLTTIGAGNVRVELLPQLSGSANVRYQLTFIGTRTALDVPQTTITTTGPIELIPVSQEIIRGVSGVRLGTLITSEFDATITPAGNGDLGNDGVTFASPAIPISGASPIFNRNITTNVTVTASGPGFLSAWFDFNGDGDWDDPNEQIDFNNSLAQLGLGAPIQNFLEFTADKLTQTIAITVPPTAPVPTTPVSAFARFRFSSAPVLLPTGLAGDGEVEDYSITVVGGNPPSASNTNYIIAEDNVLNVGVSDGLLTRVTDPDDVLPNPSRVGFTVREVVGPSHATAFVLNADGSFTYTPAPDYFGEDSFTYQVFDGVLGSLTFGTVTLTVAPVNDPPVVPDKSTTIFKNQPLTISASNLNAGNTPGPANESSQTMTLGVNSPSVAGGTITFDPTTNTYEYLPPVNFVGVDSFTYQVTDNGDPSRATVGQFFITVSDRNTPPVARPDVWTPNPLEDTTVSLPFGFFTSNDAASDGLDPNEAGQTVALTGLGPNNATSITSTAGGTVTIQNGNVVYTPRLNFNGIDTFTYTITDTGTPPATAVGVVTVTVRDANDAPQQLIPLGTVTVAEDSVVTPIVLSNFFTDPDFANGDVLAYSIDSNSNPGMVTPSVSTTGQLLLPLVADQNGTAIIVVRATDRDGLSVTNTLTLVVTPVADQAKSTSQIPGQNVNEDAAPINITLAPTHFINPDNLGSPATGLTYIASSSNPSVVQTSVVNGVLQLTLQPNAFGSATITVTANNGNGPVTQTFAVNVAAVNDAPTTVADVYGVPANFVLRATDATGSVTVTTGDNGVLANDSDVEGNTFTASVVRQPTRGVLTFNPNGTFTYAPNFGAVAGQSDSFTYIARDSFNAPSSETTVTLNFTAPIRSPHQNPDTRWQFAVGAGISSPDVNADGFVSPIDALLIINYLNDRNAEQRVPFVTYNPPPFRDVNGDMLITPTDIIQVINFLNARTQGRNAEGEGLVDSSSGSILAAAPAVSNVTTWSTSTETIGNSLVPMKNVPANSLPIGNGVQSNTSTSAVDIAMSDILSVDSDDSNDEYDFLADPLSNNESAFDEAISDLFNTTTP